MIRMSSKQVLNLSDYIRTFTGIRFYPMEPDPAQIEIRDIAHALPMICRGNGHVSGFYSVGQHCLNCSREAEMRGLPCRIQLACLLHDAGECYLSDVPRPFKKQLPSYTTHEERILSMIYEKYLGSDLTPEEKTQVKDIDDRMLAYDLKILLHEDVGELPSVFLKLDYEFPGFEAVEQDYLNRFELLINKLKEN